jgi:hypothetical protein
MLSAASRVGIGSADGHRAVLRTLHRILHGLLADFTRFALVDIGHAAQEGRCR